MSNTSGILLRTTKILIPCKTVRIQNVGTVANILNLLISLSQDSEYIYAMNTKMTALANICLGRFIITKR